MEWIDCKCMTAQKPRGAADADLDDYLAEMKRLNISQALIVSSWSSTIAPDAANLQLFDDLATHPILHPVPEVLPEGGEAFMDRPADAIADYVSKGAVAGLALPGKNAFVLTAWCAGEMLEAMQERRLPLVVRLPDVPPDHLHDLLRDFPELPVLLQDVPREGYNRVVWPLLQKFSNLHLCFETRYSVHDGYAYLVNRFGAERFFWGTDYPDAEPGAAITGLRYTDISETDLAMIASKNIERLIGEIVYD